MGLLESIFGKKRMPAPKGAVLITLHGTFADVGGELTEFAAFEDELIEVVENSGAGMFDGNEIGQGEATLYLYGPSADQLYAPVEPFLRSASMARGARIVVRQGGPGSPERVVQL